MTINLENFQQLAIALAARDLKPNILTLEFLKGSGVIPSDWELARPSVLSSQGTRMVFKNGMSTVGQPGRVTFSEPIGGKSLDELSVAKVATEFAAALPNLDYRAVGINPQRFATFETEAAAHQYIAEHILQPGDWQGFGTEPMQAGVNLVYTLERCKLRLSINQARLKAPEQEVPAVLFGGNFHYDLSGKSPTEKQQALSQAIEQWRSDYSSYQDLIEQKFLARTQLADGASAALYGVAN